MAVELDKKTGKYMFAGKSIKMRNIQKHMYQEYISF